MTLVLLVFLASLCYAQSYLQPGQYHLSGVPLHDTVAGKTATPSPPSLPSRSSDSDAYGSPSKWPQQKQTRPPTTDNIPTVVEAVSPLTNTSDYEANSRRPLSHAHSSESNSREGSASDRLLPGKSLKYSVCTCPCQLAAGALPAASSDGSSDEGLNETSMVSTRYSATTSSITGSLTRATVHPSSYHVPGASPSGLNDKERSSRSAAASTTRLTSSHSSATAVDLPKATNSPSKHKAPVSPTMASSPLPTQSVPTTPATEQSAGHPSTTFSTPPAINFSLHYPTPTVPVTAPSARTPNRPSMHPTASTVSPTQETDSSASTAGASTSSSHVRNSSESSGASRPSIRASRSPSSYQSSMVSSTPLSVYPLPTTVAMDFPTIHPSPTAAPTNRTMNTPSSRISILEASSPGGHPPASGASSTAVILSSQHSTSEVNPTLAADPSGTRTTTSQSSASTAAVSVTASSPRNTSPSSSHSATKTPSALEASSPGNHLPAIGAPSTAAILSSQHSASEVNPTLAADPFGNRTTTHQSNESTSTVPVTATSSRAASSLQDHSASTPPSLSYSSQNASTAGTTNSSGHLLTETLSPPSNNQVPTSHTAAVLNPSGSQPSTTASSGTVTNLSSNNQVSAHASTQVTNPTSNHISSTNFGATGFVPDPPAPTDHPTTKHPDASTSPLAATATTTLSRNSLSRNTPTPRAQRTAGTPSPTHSQHSKVTTPALPKETTDSLTDYPLSTTASTNGEPSPSPRTARVADPPASHSVSATTTLPTRPSKATAEVKLVPVPKPLTLKDLEESTEDCEDVLDDMIWYTRNNKNRDLYKKAAKVLKKLKKSKKKGFNEETLQHLTGNVGRLNSAVTLYNNHKCKRSSSDASNYYNLYNELEHHDDDRTNPRNANHLSGLKAKLDAISECIEDYCGN